ncbi:MAG: hypothetical protein Q4C10_11825 [Clostridia bacterium]|nr:hypothetical protein [Clostridia bacterium]
MRLRKVLCALLLAALLAETAVPALALEKGQLLRVDHCGKWAALRAEATAKSPRLAKLYREMTVVYERTERGFCLVRCGTRWGYVARKYLEKQGRALRVNKKVWLREAPSADGGKLKKLKKGATVVALAEGQNGYYYVQWNDWYGYVSATALRAAKAKDGRKAWVVCAGKHTALREAASDDGHRLTSIPRGSRVYAFGGISEGWQYVYWKGKWGYVDADMLYFKR